jgi:hypothetical protein
MWWHMREESQEWGLFEEIDCAKKARVMQVLSKLMEKLTEGVNCIIR